MKYLYHSVISFVAFVGVQLSIGLY